jgi:sugar lactone lactonase YvrE
VEEVGALLIGHPGFGADIVSLFATGPNPLSGSQSREEHLRWAADPLHSYVVDGTGALCVWAHPRPGDGPSILALEGLTGMEVLYGHGSKGYPGDRDKMWDQILTANYESGRQFVWGFAADDTHDLKAIGLRWYAALLPTSDEFALKRALREGSFYVSTGPSISAIRAERGDITLELDQVSDVFWLRSGQYLEGAMPHAMEVSRNGGANRCLQTDRGVRIATLDTAAFGLAPSLKFVRALVHTQANSLALTQPFRLRSGQVDNPYPDSGTWVRGQTHNHTDSSPSHTNLPAYRAAYQARGHLASFSLDYSYREYPYQWLPEDWTPQIMGATPSRLPVGEQSELVVRGVNFLPGTTVALNGLPLEILASPHEGELHALVPSGLSLGTYDITVTTPRRFRDTRPHAFVVHQRQVHLGWRSYATEDGLPYPLCTAVAQVGSDVWVATLKGLARFRDDRWSILDDEEAWYAILADPAGGAWIAGDSGLVRHGPDGTVHRVRIGEQRSYGYDSPERWGRMAFDRQGDLWVTNRWWAGLGVRQDSIWHRLTTADGAPSNGPTAVTCDGEGVIWMGFDGGGPPLYRRIGASWEAVPLPQPVAGCSFVSVLASSSDGAVWAAATNSDAPSPGGVVRFHRGTTTVYTPDNGLPTHRIRDILPARDGSVWFASDLGVSVLDRNAATWSQFSPQNSALTTGVVLGLAEDTDGAIWCATANGVSRYSRPVERRIPPLSRAPRRPR